jgi:hypothetical protein
MCRACGGEFQIEFQPADAPDVQARIEVLRLGTTSFAPVADDRDDQAG